MKLQFREHSGIDYSKYAFPYCVYCLKEENDNYSNIYSKGFLPYTNELQIEEEIYYLARSVRIELMYEIWNYKQKNIFNKFSKIYNNDFIKIELHKKETYLSDKNFEDWCILNAKNHFLTVERLNYIESRPYLKEIMTISYKDDVLAYLFIVNDNFNFIHTWYSFYDLTKNENDFGKWILLKAIEWSKNQGYQYFYIGTCYSKSAFYKLTLSPFTTYFNGIEWTNKVSDLKKRLLTEKK